MMELTIFVKYSIPDSSEGSEYTPGKKVRKQTKVHTLFLISAIKLDLNKCCVLSTFLLNAPF